MTARRMWWTGVIVAMAALAACGDQGPDPVDPGAGAPEPPGPPDPPEPPEPPSPPTDGLALNITGGGHNVTERFTSDLWVHGEYAYTGTWGGFEREGNPGNALKIWRLDAGGAPALVDSLILPGVGTVSDVEVSADGSVLMLSTERGTRRRALSLRSG